MAFSTFNNLIVLLFIWNIVVASSFAKNHDNESSSVCKTVLLENCTRGFCTTNIKMINGCLTNSTDDELKRKCENLVDADLLKNTFLFRPVTDNLENVTYRNMYCAVCNSKNLEAERFTFWTLRAYHEGSNSTSFVSDVNLAVLENMQVCNNTKKLISKMDDVVRKVVPLTYLPFSLKNSSYEFCSSPDANQTIEFFVANNTKSFSPVPEGFNCTGKKFCSRRKLPQPGTCRYFYGNNLPCRESKFLVENIDFVFNGSEIITNDGKTFDSDMYSNVNENVIFLCSSKDDRHVVERTVHTFIDYIKYVSTFLLFVFLVMKTNKKNFKSLTKLILYSYCVASLAVYLFQIFNYLIVGRLIFRTYLVLYIYLCYASWVMVISYEYWQVFKFERVLTDLRKYRLYGFVGWVLPALLLCAIYPSLSNEDKSAVCPRIANHHSVSIFEYLSRLASYLFLALLLLYLLIFVILIPVMCVQGYKLIRLAQNKRSIRKQSAKKRKKDKNPAKKSEPDHLIIFMKISYLMGIHFMLICIAALLSVLLKGPAAVFENMGSIFLACHGTFIFFTFGFEKVRAKYTSTYQSFRTLSTRSSRLKSFTVDMKPEAVEEKGLEQ